MITTSSVTFLTMGALFGLTAGISPGPLLTLVITETLKHSRAEGIKIAISPLITDLPIIITSYFVFSKLSQFNTVLAVISVLGGIFFAYLGIETIMAKGFDVEIPGVKPKSLRKGITANFLNPNPYIFWLTAGIPTAFKAYETSLVAVILYFLLFYLMLIGSKVSVALLVEKSKAFLNNKIYRLTMRILGIVLFAFALYFFYDGINNLRN